MLLVPATMELLGDRNWWLPRWLDRLIPDIDVEGKAEDAAPIDNEPELVGAGGHRRRLTPELGQAVTSTVMSVENGA
jgi:hypothetical protein